MIRQMHFYSILLDCVTFWCTVYSISTSLSVCDFVCFVWCVFYSLMLLRRNKRWMNRAQTVIMCHVFFLCLLFIVYFWIKTLFGLYIWQDTLPDDLLAAVFQAVMQDAGVQASVIQDICVGQWCRCSLVSIHHYHYHMTFSLFSWRCKCSQWRIVCSGNVCVYLAGNVGQPGAGGLVGRTAQFMW